MREEIKEIADQLWKETIGISGEKITVIVDEIDSVFHKNGCVISHDKIIHFVIDCIREK